jgi:hypothetical protein
MQFPVFHLFYIAEEWNARWYFLQIENRLSELIEIVDSS